MYTDGKGCIPKHLELRSQISTRRCTRMARGASQSISSFGHRFQLADVHGWQGAWNESQALSGPVLFLSRISCKRPVLREYTGGFAPYHGELLDLFFARLLPSGTGDFGIGPSQLREKQTNPIMLLPYPSTGCFLIERNSHIHGWLGLIEDEDVGTRVFDNFNLPMYTDCKLRLSIQKARYLAISTRRCIRIAS